MYIILPNSLTGLERILNEIDPFSLGRDIWAMQELPLNIWIPKFKFEFTSHLESALREVICIVVRERCDYYHDVDTTVLPLFFFFFF